MKKNLVVQIVIAFIAGLIIGIVLWLSGWDVTGYIKWVSPFGSILVSMLKMIVVPVIFLSLISGAASLPTGKFGKIGIKVIAWYFLTSLLAAVVGSLLAVAFNPGSGSNLQVWESVAAVTQQSNTINVSTGGALIDVLLGMFANPFASLANGDFLAIIVFAIAFGLGLKIVADNPKTDKKLAENIQKLLDLNDAAKEGVFKMVDWILAYSPIGVFALTSCNFANYGSALFGPYISLTTGVVLGILFMVLIVYPLLVFLTTRKNPYAFLNQIKEASLTAFVTRSSAATLPVSMRMAEDSDIDPALSSFALPLGATINMDGVCVHLPFFAILAANMFGIDLGFGALALLVITTVLASIGAGGVPGGSLMLLFIILQNMHLGPEQIAIIVGLALGINPVLDMFETMNNVTGDLVCTFCVAQNSDMMAVKGTE